jgi:hypothetical protein
MISLCQTTWMLESFAFHIPKPLEIPSKLYHRVIYPHSQKVQDLLHPAPQTLKVASISISSLQELSINQTKAHLLSKKLMEHLEVLGAHDDTPRHRLKLNPSVQPIRLLSVAKHRPSYLVSLTYRFTHLFRALNVLHRCSIHCILRFNASSKRCMRLLTTRQTILPDRAYSYSLNLLDSSSH